MRRGVELDRAFRIWHRALTAAGPQRMKNWILLAGVGQLVLALGSLAIPRVLRWKEDVAQLRRLTRQVFWTYAAYIWSTNVAFGLVSVLAPESLIDGSILARCVCGFIAAYWGARVLIQIFWFDRSDAPSGIMIRVAEAALTLLFAALTIVYGWAAFRGA